MASEKYLGAPSDSGEWWCDRSSTATDLGPGVSFSVRCGEDGGNGPHLICCYGLREDVRLDRVQAEAERILAEYQKPNSWHPEGRKLQGPLRMPPLMRWKTLDEELEEFRKSQSLRQSKAANLNAGKMIWSLRDILWDCMGSGAMVARAIELAGIEKIQEIYDSVGVA
jgi:hypothetical protein